MLSIKYHLNIDKLTYEEYLKIKDELSKIQIHENRTDEDMAKLWSIKD